MSGFTGYVVVQVENRLSRDEYRHLTIAMTHNVVISHKHGYEYCLFVGPHQVLFEDGFVGLGYWSKVPFILLALRMYPVAKGLMFIDSDAYLGSVDIDTYLKNNLIDLDSSPLVIHEEHGHWFRVLRSHYPHVYNGSAINSGVLLFNPRHQVSLQIMRQWWLNATKVSSPLEVYLQCIMVKVACNGAPDHVETIEHTLTDLYGLNHPGQLFKCVTGLDVVKEKYNQSSIAVTGHQFTFTLRAFSTQQAFDTARDFTNTRSFRMGVALKHCHAGVRSVQLKQQPSAKYKLDFRRHSWPGDQERLQWVLSEYRPYVRVIGSLAEMWLKGKHDDHRDLSACSDVYQCLVYHPCSSNKMKQSEAANVYQAHVNTTWAKEFPDVPPSTILDNVKAWYLGERCNLQW